MTVTNDLTEFGSRELRMAAELLTAYCDNRPDWLGDGVTVSMNTESGYVFLTDEDFNVAMLNGGKLDAWLFTPYHGHEGFIADLTDEYSPDDLNGFDVRYIRNWADTLNFVLPTTWSEE